MRRMMSGTNKSEQIGGLSWVLIGALLAPGGLIACGAERPDFPEDGDVSFGAQAGVGDGGASSEGRPEDDEGDLPGGASVANSGRNGPVAEDDGGNECSEGEAGRECAEHEPCLTGDCQPSCDQGWVLCEGACIDPRHDELFCGARGSCVGRAEIGTDCTAQGADAVCVHGTCRTWAEATIEIPLPWNSPAHAESEWLDLTLDDSGHATAVVLHTSDAAGLALTASFRPPLDAWSPPKQLSSTLVEKPWLASNGSRVSIAGGEVSGYALFGAEVEESGSYRSRFTASPEGVLAASPTVAESGSALVAFKHTDRITYFIRDEGGTWLDAQTIPFLGDSTSTSPELASTVRNHKGILVVWSEGEPGARSLRHAWFLGDGGYVANSYLRLAVADAGRVELVSDGRDHIYLTYFEGDSQVARIMRYDLSAENWTDISAGHPLLVGARELESAVFSDGDLVTAVWNGTSLAAHHWDSATGAWTSLDAPPEPRGGLSELQLGLDGYDNLFMGWLSGNSADNELAVLRRDAADGWGEQLALGEGRIRNGRLRVARNGNAVAAWTDAERENPVARCFE